MLKSGGNYSERIFYMGIALNNVRSGACYVDNYAGAKGRYRQINRQASDTGVIIHNSISYTVFGEAVYVRGRVRGGLGNRIS